MSPRYDYKRGHDKVPLISASASPRLVTMENAKTLWLEGNGAEETNHESSATDVSTQLEMCLSRDNDVSMRAPMINIGMVYDVRSSVGISFAEELVNRDNSQELNQHGVSSTYSA